MSNNQNGMGGSPFMRNIWGWKWSMVSLIIICLFLGLAICRYITVKPEQLVAPDATEKDV
jgi:hypothetical protein